jgi:hypothetical protein
VEIELGPCPLGQAKHLTLNEEIDTLSVLAGGFVTPRLRVYTWSVAELDV